MTPSEYFIKRLLEITTLGIDTNPELFRCLESISSNTLPEEQDLFYRACTIVQEEIELLEEKGLPLK
jgi:hypothetical protein